MEDLQLSDLPDDLKHHIIEYIPSFILISKLSVVVFKVYQRLLQGIVKNKKSAGSLDTVVMKINDAIDLNLKYTWSAVELQALVDSMEKIDSLVLLTLHLRLISLSKMQNRPTAETVRRRFADASGVSFPNLLKFTEKVTNFFRLLRIHLMPRSDVTVDFRKLDAIYEYLTKILPLISDLTTDSGESDEAVKHQRQRTSVCLKCGKLIL